MKINLKATLSSLVTVVCLSLGIAGTAHADPNDLFASINGSNGNGAGFIYRYTPTGTQSTFLSGLNKPRGLAFDSAGNIFLASTFVDGTGAYQASILQIAPDGTTTTFATGFGANNFLEGLVFDGSGNIFVNSSNLSDPDNVTGTIFKVAPNGTFSAFGTVPGQAFGVAIDSSGNVYGASGAIDRTIYKFTPGGVRSVFVGPASFAAGQGPIGLIFDSAGNLVVSTGDGPGNGEILKFAPDGTKTVFATGLTHAPRGMAYDSSGNLFVAEVSPSTAGDILKFTPGGVMTTFASGIGNPSGNGGPEYLAIMGTVCGCPGPAGVGLVSGSTLLMKQGSAPPAGFTKLGTTDFQYKDLASKNQKVTLDVYQKN